ncbi:cytochrome P450 [Mycena rosella]|uniref:Cytochrome P450 n=1 Tax=Mycena rosella TaxID=1033263 RepID=A0AAD7BY05_MYCRO|nr:cytochrome P450 [Mycena rosella]
MFPDRPRHRGLLVEIEICCNCYYGDHEFTWLKKFGPVYLVKGCFGQNRLMISDPLALQYILNSSHFGHGPTSENVMDLILDRNAIVASKGETHKRLRAALNIGFTSSAVRNYRPIFEKVAEKITERLDKCSGSLTDLYPILSPATLSAISEAVLGFSARDLGEAFVANNERVIINYGRKSMRHFVVHIALPLMRAWLKLIKGCGPAHWCSQETLRLYPPGAIQERITVQDTVIPLTDGIKNSKGEFMNHIPVQKGQVVLVAIASYQRLQSRWGEDAHQFRPSRWIDGTVVQGQAVGPYANLLSFLGGPRVCLGWRFAPRVLEMQVFFSKLVGEFSFALPEDDCLRTRYANMLIPVTPSGEKAAPLHITRI